MNWALHRQIIGRLGPLLALIAIPWFIAAYLYLDPPVALGLVPAPKASWGEFPHSNLAWVVFMIGMNMTTPIIGVYIGLYIRLRAGARLHPLPRWIYPLFFGSVACAAVLVYVYLTSLMPH